MLSPENYRRAFPIKFMFLTGDTEPGSIWRQKDELRRKFLQGLGKSMKNLVQTKAAKKGNIKTIPAKKFLPLVTDENA